MGPASEWSIECSAKSRSKARTLGMKKKSIASIVLAIAVVWTVYDLYGPRSTSLRTFDPDEVARIETAMWRSYYGRQRARLFNQMSELMRTQYNFPFLRSNSAAYEAAKAAFVFKDGRGRADYERALPNLISFYSAIRKVADVKFDPERAARLELEWWIIHRERAKHQPGDLAAALAELPALLYDAPAGKLMEHARLRAEAMTIRDDEARRGGVSEEDWKRIDELLHQSWRSLHEAVNKPGRPF